MSMNYSKGKPLGNNNVPQFDVPPAVSVLAAYSSENAVASSVISLTDNTTAVEIAAFGAAAVMRWVATSDTQASVVSGASGANLYHVIPQNTVRRFVVPRETQNNAQGYSSMVGTRVAEGLFARLAYKTTGISSVITTEY